MADFWLKCTECKSEIAYGARYYQCSVSTCNRSRLRLVFCSVVCWDSHLADARHREAWAEEAYAPTREAWQRELAADPSKRPPPAAPTPTPRPAAPVVIARPAAAPTPMPIRPDRDPSQPVRSGAGHSPDSVEPGYVRPPPTPNPAPLTAPAPAPSTVRRVVGDASPVTAAAVVGVSLAEVTDRDMMIVISKLKKYIKDRSGMNCSDAVADVLSDHVRLLCDESIRAAARDERKTVLDRDVPRVRR